MKWPDFQNNVKESTFDDVRYLSMRRMCLLRNNPLLQPLKVFENPKYITAAQNVLFTLDGATFIKLSVSFQMFPGVIQSLGTKRHYPILEDVLTDKVIYNLKRLYEKIFSFVSKLDCGVFLFN